MSLSVRGSRRILALYLPHFLSEIANASRCSLHTENQRIPRPLGIVVVDSIEREPRPSEVLTAVCPRAARAGVRAGQTLTEASALVSDLRIELLEQQFVEDQLVAIAESITGYGTTISWTLPNTIWLDVSGVAHLFGGEQSLADEVQEYVRLQGHLVRVVIASGPVLAQAICKTTQGQATVVSQLDLKETVQELPLSVLPLDQERLSWFSRLGVLTIGQLKALPSQSTSSRLGPQAMKLLLLMDGIDETPLKPGIFPEILTEKLEWEEPAFGLSPLLFALHGLVAKLHTRLSGRGEACSLIELSLEHDQGVARHLGVLSKTVVSFELSSPLHHSADIERILKTRLERLQLRAPTVGLCLSVSKLSPQLMNQLAITSHRLHRSDPTQKGWGVFGQKTGVLQKQELSVLIAELQADLKQEDIGTLALVSSHKPEDFSSFVPILGKSKKKHVESSVEKFSPVFERITRLLPEPQALCARLRKDECVTLNRQLYHIEKIRFLQRLDRVEWWNSKAASRDYFWIWLKGPLGSVEALFFTDRTTNRLYLQGFGD
jgi:protein ImuB